MHHGHILFVDDDVLAQWVLSDVLDRAGYRVTSVCRADDAMRLIGDAEEFDLLLTDILLPDEKNGLDLAEFWRTVQPGRPVIYTTSLARSILGALEEGEDFLQKPCCGEELLRVVDEALSRTRRYASQGARPRRPAWVH